MGYRSLISKQRTRENDMIDHNAEKAAIAAATEHTYGCFEQVAEELVEAGIAETGEYDEVLPTRGFRDVLTEWLMVVTEERERCSCHVNAPADDDELVAA